MEILSRTVGYNTPFFINVIALLVGMLFVILASIWLVEIIFGREEWSEGVIVFFLIGIVFTSLPFTPYGERYQEERVTVIVSDWNVVHENKWEIISQEEKITVLKRRLNE